MIRNINTLHRDERGVTVIEFAIILPLIFMTIFGLIDVAFQAYMKATVQGTLNKAGRDSTLENAATELDHINASVTTAVRRVSSSATIASQRRFYNNFSQVSQLEDYNDNNRNGTYEQATECFKDINNNGIRDERGQNGLGGADDIVSYVVTVNYPRLFPLGHLLGWPDKQSVTATTILRNQPYGSQSIATERVVCPPTH